MVTLWNLHQFTGNKARQVKFTTSPPFAMGARPGHEADNVGKGIDAVPQNGPVDEEKCGLMMLPGGSRLKLPSQKVQVKGRIELGSREGSRPSLLPTCILNKLR